MGAPPKLLLFCLRTAKASSTTIIPPNFPEYNHHPIHCQRTQKILKCFWFPKHFWILVKLKVFIGGVVADIPHKFSVTIVSVAAALWHWSQGVTYLSRSRWLWLGTKWKTHSQFRKHEFMWTPRLCQTIVTFRPTMARYYKNLLKAIDQTLYDQFYLAVGHL